MDQAMLKVKGDRILSGMDKAAVMLLSLDEDAAAEVLKLLDEAEIQRLTSHSTRLGKLSMELIDNVRKEFLERLLDSSPLLIRQARDQLRGILKKILPPERYDKFCEMLEQGEDLAETFEAIRWIDSQTIAAFLNNEHPQTVAVVMAHMDAEKSTEVLMQLPKEVRAEVVMRIANLNRINPELVREVQDVILTEIMASGANKSRLVGGAEAVAEILNNLDSQNEELIFNVMEEKDPDMAEKIRELMFVFEDLQKLEDRDIQQIMKEVTNDLLTMALKTAPEELKDRMLRNVSSRAAEMIREDLNTMGPVKLSDVEKAQQEIVKICRRLESEGKLALTSAGGGEVFV